MRSDACSLVWEGRVLRALKFGALMREGLWTSRAAVSPVWGCPAAHGGPALPAHAGQHRNRHIVAHI